MEQSCEVCGATLDVWLLNPVSSLLRCPSCQHIRRDYESCHATARKTPYSGNPVLDRVRFALLFRRLNAFLGHRKGLQVLEMGYGSGKLLALFHRKGHHISGIDPSPFRIHPEVRDHATLYEGAAEDIDLPCRRFDLIVGIHVVEHLNNPAKVFERCYDALRDNGILYLATPNAMSTGLSLFKEHWLNLEDPSHIRFFSPESLKIMLMNCGFREVITRRLLWDGIRVEANSFLRSIMRNYPEQGIESQALTNIICGALVPFTAIARLICPALSPTLEAVAYR